jgi:hypothetical protein
VLGAVAYDAKVVTIWDGFKEYLASSGPAVRLRPLLELRAAGRGAASRAAIDVAWNSPLAWLQDGAIARRSGRPREPIAMRDTDRT